MSKWLKENCINGCSKRYTLEFAISNRDFSWQDTWTDFGQKRLDRFCERFNSKTEAICDGDIIWDDLIETLKEETGLEFAIRENK